MEKRVYIEELSYYVYYKMTRQMKEFEEIGLREVFGLMGYREGYCESNEKHLCSRIEDVSSNYGIVRELFEKISHYKALPVHIDDIVLDTLSC